MGVEISLLKYCFRNKIIPEWVSSGDCVLLTYDMHYIAH